jgi:hypothetical protein
VPVIRLPSDRFSDKVSKAIDILFSFSFENILPEFEFKEPDRACLGYQFEVIVVTELMRLSKI